MSNVDRRKVILVAGARPNFMKIAPLMRELENHPVIEPILVHTGQHYDDKMSDLFFEQLSIPKPDVNLKVGSASHAVQTARIMEKFETVCADLQPDLVLVVGDVNSTVSCTLVPSKMGIKTAHYEAGLRSRDKSMPEEINRIVTDAISDLFFTTSSDADENLLQEGKQLEQIYLVGNLMIDTLLYSLNRTDQSIPVVETLDNSETANIESVIAKKRFGVITFHRPSNVDTPDSLGQLVEALCKVAEQIPLIFPIHPRTAGNLQKFGLAERVDSQKNLFVIHPQGYMDFIKLVRDSFFVLTDSGGIQEETTVMDKPCLTVRPNTERPITILQGTNKLIKIDDIESEVAEILAGQGKTGQIPPFWDGRTAGRIVEHLTSILS